MSAFKVLRLLRILRPIRLLSRNEGLKLAIRTLRKALPHLLNLFMVLLVVLLLFAIFLVSFLKGRLYYCLQDNILVSDDFIDNKWDCLNHGGEWVNTRKNYDTVTNAMVSLFEIGAVSWYPSMWTMVDSRGVNLQPKLYNNLFWILLMLLLVVVFMFFCVNLVIGVVVMVFNLEREELGKNFLLTSN